MIQAVKDCNVIKLNSVLNNRDSYSRKELNFCFFNTAQSGCVECMKCLLTCDNLDLNLSNSSGKTALMLSSENGHAEIVSLLLSDSRCKVDQRNENSGQTALHFAAKSNNFECSKRLLEAGANVSVRDFEDNTPLLLLSYLRMPNLALMKLLTACCINAQNNQGQTALHLTSFRAIGTELLLALGADANLQDSSGNTALHIASIEGLDAIVICLITYNCNVNICNNYGKLALHYLAMKGHDVCIEAISKVGGDLNLIDKDSKSPLVYSIENKRFKAFLSLLSNNCCPDGHHHPDVSSTPVQMAFKLNLYVEVMILLLVGCQTGPMWKVVQSSNELKERIAIASMEDYDEDDRLIENGNNTGSNNNSNNNNYADADDDMNTQSNVIHLDWSLRYITHAPTLKHLCRLALRKMVRMDAKFTSCLTSLPPLIQDYVLFRGCYSLWNYIQEEHLNARI